MSTDKSRRWVLTLAGLVLLSVLTVFAVNGAFAQQGAVIIELEPLVSGLSAPIGVSHAGDGSGRKFIIDQTGQIWIVQDGELLAVPFLDIADKLPELSTTFDERGLLGLAFHPLYAENGRFFVRYSAPRIGGPQEPCFESSRGCHKEILAEYAVSKEDPNRADPDSEVILFAVDEPQFNHNAGEVAFGPDGYLYFGLGDGGGAHDGLADEPPSHGPIGNAQNIETPLGAILRIDVDSVSRTLPSDYSIPADNPFVDQPGLDEIYAYGLRNPYRFSFDDGPGGDGKLYLGDVGQNLFEEINIIELGGNYGWVIREGLHCFDPFNPTSPPESCPGTGSHDEPLLDPIVEYAHPSSGFMREGGITVIAGYVYRGIRSPRLAGSYIFGDFTQGFAAPTGTIYFISNPLGENPEIQEFQIGLVGRPYGLYLKGFGEDEDGEIYVCGSTSISPTGNEGSCARIFAIERTLLPAIFGLL